MCCFWDYKSFALWFVIANPENQVNSQHILQIIIFTGNHQMILK